MYLVLVWHLFQPTPVLFFGGGLALGLLWKRRLVARWPLRVLTAAYVLLFVLHLPIVAWLALGTLEWSYPPLLQRPADVDAIVVLASRVEPPTASWPYAEMDTDTVSRCSRAVVMYQAGTACPVIVSGRNPDPNEIGPPYATVMARFLEQLGVRPTDILREPDSRTTYENAVESARLLRERGLHRILLVTTASHLKRATRCFAKQGIEVIPCGGRYQSLELREWGPLLIPSPGAARDCEVVIHEWFGLAWYWCHGRI